MAKMELRDTVGMMCGDDYKERFVAEYAQTKIRYEKLKTLCNRVEAARYAGNAFLPYIVVAPSLECPLELLREQQDLMGNLLHVLEMRAVIENIKLPEVILCKE